MMVLYDAGSGSSFFFGILQCSGVPRQWLEESSEEGWGEGWGSGSIREVYRCSSSSKAVAVVSAEVAVAMKRGSDGILSHTIRSGQFQVYPSIQVVVSK